MRLRQEQTVFLITTLLLGFMGWSLLTGEARRRSSRGRPGDVANLEHQATPPVDVAIANRAVPPLRRELFSPPRDTRPLPPLSLIEPPREPLAELLPPTDPGPAAGAFGRTLRTTQAPVDRPELFEQEDDDLFADAGAPDEADDATGAPTVVDDLRAARDAEIDPFEDETPAQREARYESYRKRYDWIQRGPGAFIFGRIASEERYGLKADPKRAGEPVLFIRVDPETGQEYFKNVGAPPIAEDRAAMVDWGFADTVANEIEVRRLMIGGELRRDRFDQAMHLADYAVHHRLDASRALEIAEELYRLCAAFDPEDPEPRLGLARCLEAGFRFEEAFAEYNALLEQFEHRAEVHARLGLLEERFLLFVAAEERLARAVSIDRNSWEARLAMGSFLSRRARRTEAVEHLRSAVRAAPSEPELLHLRVGIRVALADALFAIGEIAEARSIYALASSADLSHQRARAGVIATELLLAHRAGPDADGGADAGIDGNGAQPADIASTEEPESDRASDGFELLMVRGLGAFLADDFETARDLWTLAVDTDPLRASRASSALSFLAQFSGQDAAAMGFIEDALENDPTDAYALYRRGRLLGMHDDYEGARASLLAALDQEIDFEDALVALGEMAFNLGRFDDAERYLERAIAIDAEREEVHALRGLNLLRLGLVPDARATFDKALALDSDQPAARAGRAWCAYLDGDITEARIILANLDESRRNLPDDDAWRVWTRDQIERIKDHVEKVEWRDSFNRNRLINGWLTREGSGPIVSMEDGAVKIEGSFSTDGTTQVYREYIASDFVSFSANVWLSATNVRAGVFIARERQRRQSREVIGEASVSRHKDGSLQVRFIRQGQPLEETDMQQSLPTGEWKRLSIERHGTSSDTTITIALDGIPLVEGVPVPSIGGTNSPLLIGLFVEGQTGRQVLVKMTDASVIYRGNR